VEKLHTELGNTLAVNSASQGMHRKSLVNVWRLTSEAQSEINQLPLTLLPVSKTEDFLTHISNFSYKTAVRDLTKQPLSPDEMKTLKTLYENSKGISSDLQKVQEASLSNQLKWTDVEQAMASEGQGNDNTIVDGFRNVDKKVGAYPEINWGPAVASVYSKRSVKMLSGNNATPEEIKKKATEFFGDHKIVDVKVVENGAKTEYASYSAIGKRKSSNSTVHLDYTKRGGHLIRFMDTRNIGKKAISQEKALAEAKKFLEMHKYPSMEPVSYDEYDNIGSFIFVRKENGILIYPERLIVRIALDNGEVTGIEASDFEYKKHKTIKTDTKPKLTEAQAKKMLNPGLKEKYHRLAIIENDLGEPTLCYEFVGDMNGTSYRIYVNATTGMEENIEELKGTKQKSPA
jgi:spore germination protein